MPTIIDMCDYIIALKQEIAKKDILIQQLEEQIEEINKGKK